MRRALRLKNSNTTSCRTVRTLSTMSSTWSVTHGNETKCASDNFYASENSSCTRSTNRSTTSNTSSSSLPLCDTAVLLTSCRHLHTSAPTLQTSSSLPQEEEEQEKNQQSESSSTEQQPRRVVKKKSRLRKSLRSSDDTLNALLDEDETLQSMMNNKGTNNNKNTKTAMTSSSSSFTSQKEQLQHYEGSDSKSKRNDDSSATILTPREEIRKMKQEWEQEHEKNNSFEENKEVWNAQVEEDDKSHSTAEQLHNVKTDGHYTRTSESNITNKLRQTLKEFTVSSMPEEQSSFVEQEEQSNFDVLTTHEKSLWGNNRVYSERKMEAEVEREEEDEEEQEWKLVQEMEAKQKTEQNESVEIEQEEEEEENANTENTNNNKDNVKELEYEEEDDKVESDEEVMKRRERKLEEQHARRQAYLLSCSTEDLVNIITHYLQATVNPRLVSHDEENILFPVLQTRMKELHMDQMLDIVECHWARSSLLRYGLDVNDAIRDRIGELALHVAETQNETQHNEKKSVNNTNNKREDDGDYDSDAIKDIHTAEGRSKTNNKKNTYKEEQHKGEEEEEGVEIDYLYEDEKAACDALKAHDPILYNAHKEINAQTILRATIVMGMSAGRRKRDLEFFRVMGSYLAFYINTYKDPHDLVKVLTSFARAKIMPSQNFLALLARRLPILHRSKPMEQLPCYRALVNFARMGYEPMAIYRFLADTMMASMESKLREEAKQQILRKLRMQSMKATLATKEDNVITSNINVSDDVHDKGDVNGIANRQEDEDEKAQEQQVKEDNTNTNKKKIALGKNGALYFQLLSSRSMLSQNLANVSIALETSLAPEVQARQRLYYLTGLMPTMFTRFLFILGRFGAPHQQYLRPFIQPLIVPLLPFLSPPSFSRLIFAACQFKTNDVELLEPLMEFVMNELYEYNKSNYNVNNNECSRLNMIDVLSLLKLLQYVELKIPANLDRFMWFCHDVFTTSQNKGNGVISSSGKTEKSKTAKQLRKVNVNNVDEEVRESKENACIDKTNHVIDSVNYKNTNSRGTDTHNKRSLFIVRPYDMCYIATILIVLQKKLEISLTTLEPLTLLMDSFVQRFTLLLELGVVSLSQVDHFIDLCRAQQYPDTHGYLTKLVEARKAISASEIEFVSKKNNSLEDYDEDDDKNSKDNTSTIQHKLKEEKDNAINYEERIDVDVRDLFFKIGMCNETNTYGSYKPLPGPLLVDCKEALLSLSALEILQAVDLYEQATPHALRSDVQRLLSRSVLAKLTPHGTEEKIDSAHHMLILQPVPPQLFTREDLTCFVELLQRCPLVQVVQSPITWNFVREKAKRLKMKHVEELAESNLAELPMCHTIIRPVCISEHLHMMNINDREDNELIHEDVDKSECNQYNSESNDNSHKEYNTARVIEQYDVDESVVNKMPLYEELLMQKATQGKTLSLSDIVSEQMEQTVVKEFDQKT